MRGAAIPLCLLLACSGSDSSGAATAGLTDPERATVTAPATFDVRFETTQGALVMRCERALAPHGADRFFNLVRAGFYDDAAFFRALPGYVVQFGLSSRPDVNAHWKGRYIPPDRVVAANVRGSVSFAQIGEPAGPGLTPDKRSTQLFINLKDNRRLDGLGFAPVCHVTEGMDVADRLFSGYGHAGPDPIRIRNEGKAYLKRAFPRLDYIVRATIAGS